MTLNRTLAPPFSAISAFSFPPFETITSNGVPVYLVNDNNCGVLKVEFVFDAGARRQETPFTASAVNALLSEGTSKLSAREIAERFDGMGAYLQQRSGADDASLTLFCLPRFLPACLDLLSTLLDDAQFPENELVIHKQNSIQRLIVSESRSSFLTRRAFGKQVYGSANPYGSSVNQEDIRNISRETLAGFYRCFVSGKSKYLLVSGNIDEATKKTLVSFSGRLKNPALEKSAVHLTPASENIFIQKDDAVQASIRIGRPFVTRTHKDFRAFQVLNLVLGGYFGSRLMTTIREEKGLTYGIYSAVEAYQDGGAFYIETDMNNEQLELGCEAIFDEVKRLLDEPVGEQELLTVKNYYLGSFLRSLDGPFSIADRIRILVDNKLGKEYYEEFLEIINSISALELQQLANQWLQRKDLITVVTGKK